MKRRMTMPTKPIIEPVIEDDDLENGIVVSTGDIVADWHNHKDDADKKLTVQKAITFLPADQRRLVVLRFYEEETFKNIAESMGITPNEVRRLYWQACVSLKKILKGGLTKS